MPIDRDAILRAAEAAFRDTGFAAGRQFSKAITSNIWAWPNGESPRDVVDTGRLRSSQTEEYKGLQADGTFRFEFNWPVDYAAPVHQGAVFRNGSSMPARPWTRVALQQWDAQRHFARAFRAYLRNGGEVE